MGTVAVTADCARVARALHERADGEGPAVLPADASSHLAVCDVCRERERQLSRLMRLAAVADGDAVPDIAGVVLARLTASSACEDSAGHASRAPVLGPWRRGWELATLALLAALDRGAVVALGAGLVPLLLTGWESARSVPGTVAGVCSSAATISVSSAETAAAALGNLLITPVAPCAPIFRQLCTTTAEELSWLARAATDAQDTHALLAVLLCLLPVTLLLNHPRSHATHVAPEREALP